MRIRLLKLVESLLQKRFDTKIGGSCVADFHM